MSDTPSPPHSIEVEEALLGELLLFPDYAGPIVLPLLRPEDFYRESHRDVARVLLQSIEDGRPMDAVTLAHHLRTHPSQGVPDEFFVVRIMDAAPCRGDAEAHAIIVKECALRRGVIQTAAIFSEEGYRWNGRKVSEVLADHRVRVEDLERDASDARLPTVDGPDLEKTTFPPRVSLIGKRVLDEGGFLSVVSEEGVGKTWLTVDLAAMLARGGGGEWLGLPLTGQPMPMVVLYGEGGLDGAKERAVKVAGTLPAGLRFLTPEQAALDLNDPRDLGRLRAEVEFLKARHGCPSVGVVVDPQANWSMHNENEEGGPFYKRLNDFRLRTRTTLIVNHHTRKATDEKGSARSARGSTRFPAIVDAALVLNKESDGSIRASWGKLRNAAPLDPAIFRLDRETLKFVFQTTLNDRKSSAERLFEAFEEARIQGEGWLTKKQILSGAAVTERTFQRWVAAQEKAEKMETRGEVGTMHQYRLLGGGE